VKSSAKTVAQYLASLPADRRDAIKKVRSVVRKNLPKGYQEAMNWGMISYEVPLKRCPDTYNGKPLTYAALASQKGYMAIYLTAIYSDPGAAKRFLDRYRASGKKPDVGKCCVRFKKLEDLPLDLIGEVIAEIPVEKFIRWQQQIHNA
jgi:Domain of unknown function (DU1801)